MDKMKEKNMVMTILGGIFCAAAAALIGYTRSVQRSRNDTAAGVVKIRRTTSVVLAIASAVVAVLDALQMLRSANRPLVAGRSLGLGSLPDDD